MDAFFFEMCTIFSQGWGSMKIAQAGHEIAQVPRLQVVQLVGFGRKNFMLNGTIVLL